MTSVTSYDDATLAHAREQLAIAAQGLPADDSWMIFIPPRLGKPGALDGATADQLTAAYILKMSEDARGNDAWERAKRLGYITT